MHTKLARAALIVVLLGTTSLLGEELRVNTLWRMGSYTKNVGAANLIVRDVVGDSRNDIVSCANGYAFALSFDGTTYNDTWHSPFAACNAVAVGDRDGTGINRVFVGTSAGYYSSGPSYIYVFDGTSYGPELAKVQVSTT